MVMKSLKSMLVTAGAGLVFFILLDYCWLWKFNNKNMTRKEIHFDSHRVDKIDEDIQLLCVVFCSKKQRCDAIIKTWSKKCEELVLWPSDSKQHPLFLTYQQVGPFSSSFHRLCECIRTLVHDYSHFTWTVFVKDDMFLVPENAKWLITYLRKKWGSDAQYLGHGQTLWGSDYNWAGAGFILSMQMMITLVSKFNSSEACAAGGKYWKQEDYYLGQHLQNINIHPVDTRDELGYSTFLGYDLEKMMFPGSNVKFSSYYSKALHPVKCCGSRTISFPVLSYTDMYKYYYIVYGVKVHFQDNEEVRFPIKLKSDDYIWKSFLLEKGMNVNISAKEYENLWYVKFGNATALPKIADDTDNIVDSH